MATLLFNKPKYKSHNDKPILLRILIDSRFTRIDFGYQSDPIYVRGGWVTINPETFLRYGNNNSITMIKSENIPLEPVKHNFESSVDSLYFSLIFPPLPEGTTKFDLIEKEPVTPTLFNYYDIDIDKNNGIPIFGNSKITF